MFKARTEHGHQAGKAVVEEHEQRHGDRRDDHRELALPDGLRPQRGLGGHVADRRRLQGGGQAAGVDDLDDLVDFLLGEIAGDAAADR